MTPPDPIAEFKSLLANARARETFDATACALATSSAAGAPSVRIVLLKDVDEHGFTFFTNYTSRKGAELDSNPQAALCFYWPTLGVQVRTEGKATRVSAEESQAYFATRPRESQLGAWASHQSAPLPSRDALLARFREHETRFSGQPVPCPPHWGGYRLSASRIEIWRAGDFRLHDRQLYVRTDTGWSVQTLFP
jgi:pyridoxamine 5'-phosphate oxidase